MNLTIFGTGYVGLVTGACFAESGNNVCCVDIDEAKVEGLRRGVIPIYEPGLANLVKQNTQAGRLTFTTNPAEGLDSGQIIFIAVGTPMGEDGSTDLSYVETVAHTIGHHLNHSAVIVDKSTVPVGTADRVREIITEEMAIRSVDIAFDVVSNPEFLKEGAAIDDFMRPDRIIVGAERAQSIEIMQQLYAPFNRNHDRFMVMDIRSAELTKYAANAMLATKISFMNEIANIAERVGANIENVRIGIGSDSRIGYDFIYAGSGYGGSCFPKDIRSLEHMASASGYQASLISSVERVNQSQKRVLLDKVLNYFDGDVDGMTFALWGLAFKPKTDDMREAPSRTIMEGLWTAGAKVQAFDPEAMHTATALYDGQPGLTLCESRDDAVRGADALIIATEWRQFRSPDYNLLRSELTHPVIFDGRNMYDASRVSNEGFTYIGIGVQAEASEDHTKAEIDIERLMTITAD
ncbi:UDP-glucose/GDP-mannose dehydrogenase family protein [soil metagenome]